MQFRASFLIRPTCFTFVVLLIACVKKNMTFFVLKESECVSIKALGCCWTVWG